MTNKKLIGEAVAMVVEFYQAEGLYEPLNDIIKRAKKWYNHTEIHDEETLAAVVISGEYTPGILYKEIQEIKEFYFPSAPFEYTNFSIQEIESSINDEMWR